MSYCRFENTKLALNECLDALRYEGTPSSERELKAAKQLFENFLTFCADLEIIQEWDEDALKDLLGGD
ncbi:MAG: hypothetical protein NC489_23010, partial [Ruminococcus flavefaciens]|nr:hypothetical protein [Ruminococcus flavefaciens]